MSAPAITTVSKPARQTGFVLAWAFCLLFYFGQYGVTTRKWADCPGTAQASRLDQDVAIQEAALRRSGCEVVRCRQSALAKVKTSWSTVVWT